MSESMIDAQGLPPWLAEAAQRLLWMRSARRLPHALLIAGPEGLGTQQLAEQFIALLLCEQARQPDSELAAACGFCAGCALWQAGTHADFHRLDIPEDKQSIGIEQVRALSEKLFQSSHRGGLRVALLQPAEAMTIAAANALLKTLEEPPASALLILLTSRLEKLPMTIRSRCQRISVAAPDRALALQWLQQQTNLADSDSGRLEQALELAGGAPLRVPALLASGVLSQLADLEKGMLALVRGERSPVEVAAAQSDAGLALQHLQRLCRRGMSKSLAEGSSIPAAVWARFAADVLEGQRQVAGGVALSAQAILENVLLRWFDFTAFLRHSTGKPRATGPSRMS